MGVPMEQWLWMGHAAHFCGAADCKFRLATKVGPWIVSTVGDYYPPEADGPQPIGSGRATFETYVFRSGGAPDDCGCYLPNDLTEVEGRRFTSASEAQAGHMDACRRFAERDL